MGRRTSRANQSEVGTIHCMNESINSKSGGDRALLVELPGCILVRATHASHTGASLMQILRSAFAGALLAALCLHAGWAGARTSLRAWNTHPDGYPVTEAMKSFIQSGEIDVAEFNSGPLGDRLAEKVKASGYVVLGGYNGGARSFCCANKLMTRPEDFAGQRVRVQQSQQAGKNSAASMPTLWQKRVVAARAAVEKAGSQVAVVKDFSPFVRKMSPLCEKHMSDPAVRGDLFAIISRGSLPLQARQPDRS